jgi:hypothetical protein
MKSAMKRYYRDQTSYWRQATDNHDQIRWAS